VRTPTQPARCSEEVLKLIAADYELGKRNVGRSYDAAVQDLEDQFPGGETTGDADYQKALADLKAEKQFLLTKLDSNRKLAETQCNPDVVLNGS
jgi:hypothetical protein